MKIRLGTWAQLATVIGMTALVTGCGDDSGGGGGAGGAGGAPAVETYPPTSSPFGKTYGEWAGEWWRWVYEMPQTEECRVAYDDASGASCAEHQDATSPVFFLAGNAGGITVRTECVVPGGKALFFPLMNWVIDNGGVPVEDQNTEEEMLDFIRSSADATNPEALTLVVDGVAVPDLGAYRAANEFAYTLPPEPNTYTCLVPRLGEDDRFMPPCARGGSGRRDRSDRASSGRVRR